MPLGVELEDIGSGTIKYNLRDSAGKTSAKAGRATSSFALPDGRMTKIVRVVCGWQMIVQSEPEG